MKKIVMLIMGIVIGTVANAEIKVKIHEPIRFKNINTKAYGELVVGQGAIEVYSTDIQEDMFKKIKIRFPEEGLMTNNKRWIKVEKFKMDDSDKEFVIEKEKRIVNFYAVIRRRELNKSEKNGEKVEGEYVGYTPIVIEQYGKPINVRPVPLPIEPDMEDTPTTLPVFPHLEDKPTVLPLRSK